VGVIVGKDVAVAVAVLVGADVFVVVGGTGVAVRAGVFVGMTGESDPGDGCCSVSTGVGVARPALTDWST
jgi:hypothetical protein